MAPRIQLLYKQVPLWVQHLALYDLHQAQGELRADLHQAKVMKGMVAQVVHLQTTPRDRRYDSHLRTNTLMLISDPAAP
jgi:hypothetical protein